MDTKAVPSLQAWFAWNKKIKGKDSWLRVVQYALRTVSYYMASTNSNLATQLTAQSESVCLHRKLFRFAAFVEHGIRVYDIVSYGHFDLIRYVVTLGLIFTLF